MAAHLTIDHVVIVVADLEAATVDFRSLGFTVTPGGVHPDWGSHNALIPLADGGYLELIAFRNLNASAGPVSIHIDGDVCPSGCTDDPGACSSHAGVNCGAGPDSDGSVICSDGFRDDPARYDCR